MARVLLLLILPLGAFVISVLIFHWFLNVESKSDSFNIAHDLSQNSLGNHDLSESVTTYWVGSENVESVRQKMSLANFECTTSCPEQKRRVQDLERIKASVMKELGKLSKKREEMLEEVAALGREMESLKSAATSTRVELERLRVSAEQAKLQREEYVRKNTPEIAAPLSLSTVLRALEPVPIPKAAGEVNSCKVSNCLDQSRCPLGRSFTVYIDQAIKSTGRSNVTEKSNQVIVHEEDLVGLKVMGEADQACIVITDEVKNSMWPNQMVLYPKDFPRLSRSIVASDTFSKAHFRPDYDFILPSWSSLKSLNGKEDHLWRATPPLLPVRRKYLISFWGQKSALTALEEDLLGRIKKITEDQTEDVAFVNTNCDGHGIDDDWQLCGTSEERIDLLKDSTFTLVLEPPSSMKSTEPFQKRLFEALQCGSVPVVIGTFVDHTSLPLSNILPWHKAGLVLPVSRGPELHFLLRSLTDADLFLMKKSGRTIWQKHLATKKLVLSTALHMLRETLMLPSEAAPKTTTISAISGGGSPPLAEPVEVEPAETLGPLEPPLPSLSFRRNISTIFLDSKHRWTEEGIDPFYMAAHTPWDPALPTDAKFLGSPSGFRPINFGRGGSGAEFSKALGGNYPAEQFTAVILTYEREQVLMESIGRLQGLPFLNKVVVVWNAREPPSEDLRWPDIGVPIVVAKTDKNSLNNRFLPFDAIQTEAILSIDDDSRLRHDEIIFGFRVWRENRDRLVGFPGRFHARDEHAAAWNYNSNYSCELSMVLTGAAFHHVHYSYLYTHVMPKAIREKVDEYMNCEDLAMNFLIAHTTGRPPIKVTSRWTFRCPDCPVILSEDDSHFQERHLCLNFFSEVYGYTPLLYTQYRADSVLFKTRIPQDKQKCFKYI